MAAKDVFHNAVRNALVIQQRQLKLIVYGVTNEVVSKWLR